MPFFWISALKDFKRRLTDPFAIVTWLGIPIVIGGLLGLVMGGSGNVKPRAKLLLVDQDDSFISQFLVDAAGGGGEDSMIDLVKVDLDEGRERIDAGEGSALLVIPEGFGQALLEETPTELQLVTNPAQRILPGILEEGLPILVEAAFYAQRLIGEQLRAFANGPTGSSAFFTSAFIGAQATAINDRMQALESTLFPPLLDLQFEVIEEEQDAPREGMGQMLFPGMLFLAMLFIAQGMSSDLWEEKAAGTLRRLFTTPQGVSAFLLGKVLAASLIIAFVTAVGLGAGVWWFEFPPAGCLPAWLWGTFSGTALVTLFLYVQSLGSSQQSASVLSSVLLFPLMMMGGSLFPMEALPAWIVEIGSWTPNGLAVVQFKALLMGRADMAVLAQDTVYLVLFSLLFFALVARRMSTRLIQA